MYLSPWFARVFSYPSISPINPEEFTVVPFFPTKNHESSYYNVPTCYMADSSNKLVLGKRGVGEPSHNGPRALLLSARLLYGKLDPRPSESSIKS